MPPSTPVRHPATRRPWFVIGTLLMVAVAIGFVRLQPERERNIADWLTAAILLVGFLLILIWFVGFSRFSRRVRLLTLASVLGIGLGLLAMVRVDGTISAIGFPRLAWKWTSNRAAPLPPGPVAAPAATAAVSVAMPDVPQFFGPLRDGRVTGARLARDWTGKAPRQLWRQPIGAGWSAFAVVGGRAFTQEQRGEEEAVTCYDVLTGRLQWTTSHPARFTQWQGGEGPRATPTVQGGQVFAYGATGVLDCLDAATGRRVWSRDVLKENRLTNLEWGVSASPLVFDDTVIVTGGNEQGPTVLAFRRATGEPLWRSGTDRASYSSPTLAVIAGRRVVLVMTAAGLAVLEPGDGKLLLREPWASERTPKAAQPVVLPGDRVFLSAGYGSGCVLLQLQRGAAGGLEAAPLWRNQRMKNQFNTVAERDGFLYGLDDGVLACVDAATGERKWKDGRYGSGQTLLVDDLILVQMETGPVVLAEAKPDGPRELGRIEALSSKTWNHPTLAGRFLLLRNDREAVCYELPVE